MPVEIILPKVDMDMSHGILAVWHVADGQLVQQGAPLFDIETDKAAMEVESPATGYLHRITAKPGDRVPVGTTIAWLYAEGETVETEALQIAAVQIAAEAPVPSLPNEPVQHDGPKPVEVILPKVDMDMTHGTLSVWHVAEGQTVKAGAPLFDIETDKAAMEVEAPATGRLLYLSAKPGDKVAVGTVMAWIYPDGIPVDQPRPTVQAASAPVPTAKAAASGQSEESAVAGLSDTTVTLAKRATPAARKAAKVSGANLSDITGTGPLGRVQRDDVTGWLSLRPASGASEPLMLTGWTAGSGPLNVSRRKGAGKPIVLLHGFTADSQSWAPFEKALGAARPLVRIDLPGHGKSPKRQVRSFQDLARMIIEAFDAATADVEDVHIVGHSVGAALAIALADVRGRRVASLTLIAPAGLGPEIDALALNGIIRASRVESLAPWLRRLTATPDAVSDDYARAAMRTREDPGLRACQADMALALFPDGVQAFDLRAALNRIAVPTQILWGRRDHILPPAHAIAAEGEFALHLLSGAGHIPQIECPDRVARIAQRLINAVEVSG